MTETNLVTVHLKIREDENNVSLQKNYTYDVLNAYEEGSFYCLELSNGTIKKYPLRDIRRIEEKKGEKQEEDKKEKELLKG